jgi:hypothetical protein
MKLQEEIFRIKELSGILTEQSYFEDDLDFYDNEFEGDEFEDEEYPEDEELMSVDDYFSQSPEFRLSTLKDMDIENEIDDIEFDKLKKQFSPEKIKYTRGNIKDYPERSDKIW